MLISPHDFHLTYCTNVHPGETWEDAFQNLQLHLPAVKKEISPEQPFGVGMYLSDRASREILLNNQLNSFKNWLQKNDLYVFTMNGFPFGGFHSAVVKDKVYLPDWTSRERVEYTKRLFTILEQLLPEGAEGSISTSPVSYKYWFNQPELIEAVKKAAAANMKEVAAFLDALNSKTGKYLHLAIEPEPDCFLENTTETLDFFQRFLFDEKKENIQKLIGVCYDVCHFSVEYEEPEAALNALISNDIQIGKIQISAAMKAVLPETPAQRKTVIEQFQRFDEPRYFHQTVKRKKNGQLVRFRDLSEALKSDEPDDEEWRTHFHVPLFEKLDKELQSTQDDVLKTLNFIKSRNITRHLEVETYTWDVLPPEMKTSLAGSIVRELRWVKENFLYCELKN